MKSNICVPIPIKSGNIREFKSIIAEIKEVNPNFIELRYDYIDDVKNITQKFIKQLIDNVDAKIPLIFTFRNHEEGGQLKISDLKRFEILKTLVLSQPNYLDIEINTEQRFLGKILDIAYQNDVNLIFSYHNFKKTPVYDLIYDKIQNFLESLQDDFGLETQRIKQIILKLVFKANFFDDNFVALNLCKEISRRKIKIISFCMGTLGIFSRITCVLNGSFLTYGSIVEETAPGQINIKNIRDSLNFFSE